MKRNISRFAAVLTSISAALILTTGSSRATTNAFSIGLNFASTELIWDFAAAAPGGTSELAPNELAGIPGVQQMNWNNVVDEATGGVQNGTTSNLIGDDRGTAVSTTATVTWVSNGTWSTSGSRGAAENNGTNFFPNLPDNKLMTGYLDTGNATTTTITFANLPTQLLSGGYHVYVYMMGGAVANRGGSVRVVDAVSGVPLTPYKLFTGPAARPTSYVEDLGVNHTDNGTYVRFNNFASSSIRIESTTVVNPNNATPRAPVNAVQLVAAGLTEPIVGAATGSAQFALLTIADLGSATVDTASVTLKVDAGSENVPIQVTKNGGTTRIVYDVFQHTGSFFAGGSTHTGIVSFAANGQTITQSRAFTVPATTVVPPAYALPDGSASGPGFKMRLHQLPIPRGPNDANTIANAERHIANGYIDPATGSPYDSQVQMAAAGAGPDGFITLPHINLNQDAGVGAEVGNFRSDNATAIADDPVPALITSFSPTPTDHYVAEFRGFLQLKAGAYRFGVNSDDGFRFSVGHASAEVLGVQLGSFNGGRGSADTMFDFVISQDGTYPVRLLWWEGGGGSNCELFSEDLVTGTRSLINHSASPIRAFTQSTTSRPYVSKVLPPAGQLNVFPNADVVVEIADGAIPADAGSVTFTLNGQTVAPTKSGNVTTIRRPGSLTSLLPGGVNNAVLSYTFNDGGQTVTVNQTWSFTVGGTTGAAFGPAYVVIPAANKVPAGTVSTAQPGVKMFVHQIDRSLDANQGNGGRMAGQGGDANQMPRPEMQLNNGYINRATGQPYPNLAQPGLNPDGTTDFTDPLNLNALTGNAGSFAGNIAPPYDVPDSPVPGLPGQGTSQGGLDNFVADITAYLNLRVGVYMVSVNSDDGFVLRSAPNVKDTLGTLVGMWNVGGGSANPPSRFVCFIITEDGLYPFRLLWWQGGGGGNLEWMSVDRDSGLRILVNDPLSPLALKSYPAYTGPARPWVKFSVYPMPNNFQNPHQQSGPGPITVKVPGGNLVEVANDAPGIRPFGDSIGAIVADLDSGTVGMKLDGLDVIPTISDIPGTSDKLVSYVPNPPLAGGSTHTATLIYGGAENSWTFTVINTVNVDASVALPVSAADTASRGFLTKVVQSSTARAGGNTAAAAETHLAGTPANVAIAGPNADGSYTIPGIINWNVTKAPGGTPTEVGNFTPLLNNLADAPVPGIPGTGLSGAARFENIAAEIFAYLELSAGYQKFGVGGDDGWKIQIGTPGKTDGQILFTTDRGAGARNIPFAFITPQAGLYPVRLVWYQGGGGGNLEFFTYGPNNEIIPVNGTHPSAVKAYTRVTGVTPVTPTVSIATASGGNVTITYTGKLQATDSLTSPNWQDVGGTSPLTSAASATQRYYRAVSQ